MTRSRVAAAPLIATLVVAALVSCSSTQPANILLVITDTLRADALACYGGGARTPHICGLAETGVLFERAYANGPWTPPSAVSIFTGNSATAYANVESGAAEHSFWVSDEEFLLAEGLRERGYDVLFQSKSPVMSEPNTLQGFEPAPEPTRPMGVRLAGVDGLAHYLWNHDGTPFYLLGWIMDPHAPYHPRRALSSFEVDRARLPRPLPFYTRLGHGTPPRVRDHAPSMSGYELEVLHRLYLAEVETVDEKVGGLLRALDAAGVRENTYIVFTSDHGEGFDEHGIFLHGRSFYDELVHIPLIVAGPGVARGRRVQTPVSLVDLMPTLADLLALDCLNDPQGSSLRALLREEGVGDRPERVHYLASSTVPTRGVDAVVAGSYKLISLPAGTVELYDLSQDPGEQRNVAAERPELVTRLLAHRDRFRSENDARRRRNFALQPKQDRLKVHEQTLKELRGLGYVE